MKTDLQTIEAIVAWLNKELGAVSAEATLPSGANVTVFKDGRVEPR